MNSGGGDVAVIDTAEKTVVARHKVGVNPFGGSAAHDHGVEPAVRRRAALAALAMPPRCWRPTPARVRRRRRRPPVAGAPMRGFTAAGAEAQRALEARFRALPTAAAIEQLAPLLHPRAARRRPRRAPGRSPSTSPSSGGRRASRTSPSAATTCCRRTRGGCTSRWWRRAATCRRCARTRIPRIPDSSQPAISGAWTSFSASGDVTAPVVYANSGNPADYDLLRQHGIDPKGKIVIVRYSNPYSYRGFKALTAEREGAAAMIVYSDPAEDGYGKGEVFPSGPWGPASHLQRGGIAYDYIVPGDPLTPGWASIDGRAADRRRPRRCRFPR